MTEPVNLNRFRKTKARADKQARASENTVKFGRSKIQKTREKATSQKAKRHLDDHKRDET